LVGLELGQNDMEMFIVGKWATIPLTYRGGYKYSSTFDLFFIFHFLYIFLKNDGHVSFSSRSDFQ
jgi:hypothetical protein